WSSDVCSSDLTKRWSVIIYSRVLFSIRPSWKGTGLFGSLTYSTNDSVFSSAWVEILPFPFKKSSLVYTSFGGHWSKFFHSLAPVKKMLASEGLKDPSPFR